MIRAYCPCMLHLCMLHLHVAPACCSCACCNCACCRASVRPTDRPTGRSVGRSFSSKQLGYIPRTVPTVPQQPTQTSVPHPPTIHPASRRSRSLPASRRSRSYLRTRIAAFAFPFKQFTLSPMISKSANARNTIIVRESPANNPGASYNRLVSSLIRSCSIISWACAYLFVPAIEKPRSPDGTGRSSWMYR